MDHPRRVVGTQTEVLKSLASATHALRGCGPPRLRGWTGTDLFVAFCTVNWDAARKRAAVETMTVANDVTVYALPHDDRPREALRMYNRLGV